MSDVNKNEFKCVTKPLIEYLWNKDYFVVPLPREKERKEFELDIPAFKKFDIVAMKWSEIGVEVKAIESKMKVYEAIPQARVYQLCMPNVYIASTEKNIDEKLLKSLNDYGIGYIVVSKSGKSITQIEARTSQFFNKSYYESEVLLRVIAILGFYDFMNKNLHMERREILGSIDLGFRVEYVWISDRSAEEGIQWSSGGSGEGISFGINLESVNAIKNAFFGKKEEDIINLFNNKIKNLPKNFRVIFERRCEEGERYMPGKKHVPFNELGWKEKKVSELNDKDIKFMIKEVRRNEYIHFGIYVDICRKEEIRSLDRNSILGKIKRFKEEYFDSLYNELKRQS
jgi:hypothetical protein